jgi:sigma-B regulation protein RsbU (phosphoserine phosphatase)
LFPREVAEKFWADDQKVLRGEPVINREEYFYDETGEKRWLLSSKLPLPDQSGAVVGLIGIARDITAIKKAEDKLAEHMRELEQRDHQTREELNMARELQLAMLPQVFPSVPSHKPAAESHLEFFSFYQPSGAVSGDFFDVVPLSDSAVGLFICDAMGHDVRAALVTAMMRALVADLSTTLNEPGELLTQMNRELAGIFKQSGSIMYATAFYLIVDLARAEFRFASAAHPDPVIVHRETGTAEWLKVDAGGKKGPALGLFLDGRFPTYRRRMAAGDLIALYTDGLVEVEGANEELYTAERLLAAVRRRVRLPGNELFNGVIDEIKAFAVRPNFDDDICLASVEVKRLETPTALQVLTAAGSMD